MNLTLFAIIGGIKQVRDEKKKTFNGVYLGFSKPLFCMQPTSHFQATSIFDLILPWSALKSKSHINLRLLRILLTFLTSLCRSANIFRRLYPCGLQIARDAGLVYSSFPEVLVLDQGNRKRNLTTVRLV